MGIGRLRQSPPNQTSIICHDNLSFKDKLTILFSSEFFFITFFYIFILTFD